MDPAPLKCKSASTMIPPRYIMKSYSYISVYYSSDQLISDIGARKSLVIQ